MNLRISTGTIDFPMIPLRTFIAILGNTDLNNTQLHWKEKELETEYNMLTTRQIVKESST